METLDLFQGLAKTYRQLSFGESFQIRSNSIRSGLLDFGKEPKIRQSFKVDPDPSKRNFVYWPMHLLAEKRLVAQLMYPTLAWCLPMGPPSAGIARSGETAQIL